MVLPTSGVWLGYISCCLHITSSPSLLCAQNKVTEGERKYQQVQEQLKGVTESIQELQPERSKLKAAAQRQDSLRKNGEVSTEHTAGEVSTEPYRWRGQY